MKTIKYAGWDCISLANDTVELVVTRDVGPRVIRYGFRGGPNVFGEIPSHLNSSRETRWMNRGGHRSWIAPEAHPWSYELDNEPYASVEEIPNGIRTIQAPGPVTGIRKELDITLSSTTSEARVVHTYVNCSENPVRMAPWAISVMGLDGMAIIPLPKKIPHTVCLTPTQNWSLWGYTDMSDKRWTFGADHILLRQDPSITTPQKIGLRNRDGWAAYQREKMLFVKKFEHLEGAEYPDGGVNFEVFVNGEILEIETLGPMRTLAPGETARHVETWHLFGNFAPCGSESEITARIRPLIMD